VSRLFVAGADRVRAVVVVDDVKCFLVRAKSDSVGLFDVMSNLGDGAVGTDSVDGSVFEFSRLVAKVTGIGEVDPSVGVEHQVVGGIQFPAANVVAQNFPFACGNIVSRNGSTTEISSFGCKKSSVSIESQAVGLVTVCCEDGCHPALWIKAKDAAFIFLLSDVRKVD